MDEDDRWSPAATLADDPAIRSGRSGEAAAIPTVELIRAALTVQLGDERLAREPWANTLALRLLADMRVHLGDPGLSPAAVAARQHISVRYLHRVLQRAGIRFGEWVRVRRLEAARRDLAGAGSGALPVAAVARRWGFPDPAYFSKAFRAAFGVSPRQWQPAHTAIDPRPRPVGRA